MRFGTQKNTVVRRSCWNFTRRYSFLFYCAFFFNPGRYSPNMQDRPNFDEIVESLDEMLRAEKGEGKRKMISSLIDRHSTWF